MTSHSYSVPIGGGTFYFNPKNLDSSAKVIFPANSFAAPKNITMKMTKIVGSTLGAYILPMSDLYTLDFDSSFAGNNITVEIPLNVDTTKFTMAFYYDPVAFELEGIPTVGYDGNTKPRMFIFTLRRSGSFFLSSIAKSQLARTVSSSYNPQIDNWEFPNYSTILTPNGQFAGQILSAAWYYYEKTLKGSPHLYGAFDYDHGGAAPKIWQDNPFGIELTAVVQQNLNWDATAFSMIAPLNNGNVLLTLDQLVYSMMVTGKPQLITVNKDSAVFPLLVYGVSNGTIAFTDPNFPLSDYQFITTSGSGKNTYRTGSSINDITRNGASSYQGATYIGVRALVDWNKISHIWQTGASSYFPSYSLQFQDTAGKMSEVNNQYSTLFDNVKLSFTGSHPDLESINSNGTFTYYNSSSGIHLKAGPNPIGIFFQTLSSDSKDTLWAGFDSVVITQKAISISPPTDSGSQQ